MFPQSHIRSFDLAGLSPVEAFTGSVRVSDGGTRIVWQRPAQGLAGIDSMRVSLEVPRR